MMSSVENILNRSYPRFASATTTTIAGYYFSGQFYIEGSWSFSGIASRVLAVTPILFNVEYILKVLQNMQIY